MKAAEQAALQGALALDQLQARGLVDDTRVAETLVNRRAGKLGSMRMRLPAAICFGHKETQAIVCCGTCRTTAG